VFQPEVAAAAVVWAAEFAPRALKVGWPTARAAYANRVAPGLLDRYLAAVGYRSQQEPASEPPVRDGNLFAPTCGDRGARGRFDAEARAASWHLKARMAAGAAAAALGLTAPRSEIR